MRCTLPVPMAAFSLIALWLGCGSVILGDESNKSQDQSSAGYTVSLFNGENLHGWHVTDCEVAAADGVLKLVSGDGFVRTDHRYGDFVLELQWRPLKEQAYDSGIYFRSELPAEGQPWPKQYQLNLQQGKDGVVGGIEGAKPRPELVKAGQWNELRLTVVGEDIRVEINGQEAWKGTGIKAPAGYIGFQAEVPIGGQFEFRNIRITELGYQSLFNGRDLAGWEPGAGKEATCWNVEDGLLVCNGKKGPWLRSEQEYGDFNLRLDYKVRPGGNSGVYTRVPKNGAHHGKQAGVEIQILDDHAPRYAKLKDYQYCGSVYAIAPSTQHVGREAGQWNSLEIDCRGTRYRVTHNGVVIVDADVDAFPQLAERLTKGYLGLQNHSEEVWFRNLRIGPPQP